MTVIRDLIKNDDVLEIATSMITKLFKGIE